MKKICLLIGALLLLVGCNDPVKQNDHATYFDFINETGSEIAFIVYEKSTMIFDKIDIPNKLSMPFDYVLADTFFTKKDAYLNPGRIYTARGEIYGVFIQINDTIYRLYRNDKNGMFYTGNYEERATTREGQLWRDYLTVPQYNQLYVFHLTREWLSQQEINSTDGMVNFYHK